MEDGLRSHKMDELLATPHMREITILALIISQAILRLGNFR